MKKWLQTETGSQIDAFPLCHKISLSVLVNTVNVEHTVGVPLRFSSFSYML